MCKVVCIDRADASKQPPHGDGAFTKTRLPLQAAATENQVYIRHVALSPPAGLTLSDTSEYSLSAESASAASLPRAGSLMGRFSMYVQKGKLRLFNIFMI